MEWYDYLSGSFFDILYLYLWYNQTISVSNGCIGGINPCGVFCNCVYCFQSHLSLSMGIVIRCFPVSLYMCATSVCVWCVCLLLYPFRYYIHLLRCVQVV